MERVAEGSPPQEGPSPWLGTALLVVALSILVVEIVDRTAGFPIRLPVSWYTNRSMWYALGLGCLFGGGWVLGRRPREADWEPAKPGRRFGAVVLFSREGCGLCDEALLVLERYRRWLPAIEIVDIESDPVLVERYGTSIPVVEFDGVARFKGRVGEFALRRLIEGTPPA